jgi:hypothetical protein
VIRFLLQRRTDSLTQEDVTKMIGVLSAQLKFDLCPAWGINPDEVEVSKGWGVPFVAENLHVFLLDERSQTELGDHDDRAIRIYVRTILDAGGLPLTGAYSVLSVVSHELCEATVDRTADQWDGSGYAKEVCDPCQGSWYEIDGCSVSDFALPAWFDPAEATQGQPMDHLGHITQSHQLEAGGYAIVRGADGVAHQLFAAELPPSWRVGLGSRSKRRLRPK